MKEITCKVAQKGFCAGPVFRIKTADEIRFSPSENTGEEKNKLREAIDVLMEELQQQASLATPENAEILAADLALLEDEDFSAEIRNVLEEKQAKLSYAVQEGCRRMAEAFENSDSEYIRQRAADLRGLGKRLIRIIENREEITPDVPSVIVAEELTPQEFAALEPEKILGLITVKGGASAHVSIMAGNLGIPYAYEAASLTELVSGAYVILDTDAEKIILNPDPETSKQAGDEVKKLCAQQEALRREAQNAKLKTKICANLSNAKNLDALTASGADGVGLFRSEFLFLESAHAPSEEEQFGAYSGVLKAMGGKDVIIRTMDIGSDKKASWLKMPEEKNPALGDRGVRLSFHHKDLFRIQLRALLRAAVYGNLKVMFPMIASEWEVDEIQRAVNQAAGELKNEGIPYAVPPLGIMIEVPAAVLIADRLAKKVAFFSIGTNDLTQYTLALDREARGMEEFYQPHHEALLKLIRMTVEAGHKAGIPVGICGELGSDPKMIPALIEAGIDELSVPVAKINAVRAYAARAEKELYYTLGSPCDGRLIPMEAIADPVFASGALGQTIGVYPEEDTLYAPVSGKLIGLPDTKHAFTIQDENGRQILVHAGINTIQLKGTGFETLAKKGDVLTKGQPVLRMNLHWIKERGFDPTVVVAVLN